MKRNLVVVILIVSLICPMFILSQSTAQAMTSWFDSSWTNRTNIVIDNTLNPNVLANYQIRLSIDYKSSMNPDFSDLRFTGDNGVTPLPYWIESYNLSISAIVWVKVSSIPALGTANIFEYYGNLLAKSLSNGTATFELFEDFEHPSSSTAWTELTSLPETSADGTSAVYNNKLYYFGGYDKTANDILSITYVFDPALNSWTQEKDMPTARWGEVAVQYNGQIYVMGGQTSANSENSQFSSYKYSNNPLTTIPKYGASGVVHPDVLYFPNGQDGYKYWMIYTPWTEGASYENPSVVRSNDGLTWTDLGISNPVIPAGAPGSFNDKENPDPDFCYVEDYNKWFMVWGPGDQATDSRQIALAYSLDGKTWIQYNGSRVNGNTDPIVLSGNDTQGQSWECLGQVSKTTTPTLLYKDGLFYLYYAEEASGNNMGKVGLATFTWNNTSNNILNISRNSNNPIISLPQDNIFLKGLGHLDVAINSDGIGYYMFGCRQMVNSFTYELVLLTSTDLLSWTDSGIVLAPGQSGSWDGLHIYRSCPVTDTSGKILLSNNSFPIYYSGWDQNNVPLIGLAYISTSPDNVLGNINSGLIDNWGGEVQVTNFKFTGATGTYSANMSVYFSTVTTTPNNRAIVGIYDDSLNKIAQSSVVTGISQGWQTFSLTTTFNLTQNHNYYLISHAPDGNNGGYVSGVANQAGWKTRTYDGTLPVNLSPLTGQEDAAYSIYLTYNSTSFIAPSIIHTNEVYAPSTNTWGIKTDVPSDVTHQGLMGVLYGNGIHLFYGNFHYVYYPATDTYERKADVPTPRSWGTCAVVNNKIYVIGGYSLNSLNASTANEVYDPLSDTWQSKTPLPSARIGVTRENPVINGQIYTTHGLDNPSGNFQSTVYIYDPLTDTWQQKSSASHPRDGVACGVISNKLYVIGGRADLIGPYGLSFNEVYDPQLDINQSSSQWTYSDPNNAYVDSTAKNSGNYGLLLNDNNPAGYVYAEHTLSSSQRIVDFDWDITNALGIANLQPQGRILLVNPSLANYGTLYYYNDGGNPTFKWYNGAFTTLQTASWNSWYHITIIWAGSNSKVIINGTIYQVSASTVGSDRIRLDSSYSEVSKAFFDNVRARQYSAQEPSLSLGPEEQFQSNITLTVNTVGSGSYSLNKAAPYSFGDVVELTAIPIAGWSFSGWSGDLSGLVNPVTITLDGNKTVTATFMINVFTVSVTPAPVHGSVVSANGTSVNYGDGLTFVVTADAGYHIVDVLVDGVSKGAVDSWDFTNVQASHTISATFAVNSFLVTVNVGSNGLSNLATQTVDSGTSLSFIFTPNLGYHVADVVVNGTTHLGSVTSYNPTITGDTSVDVTFAVNSFLVTVNVGSNGLSNLATQTVDSGTSLSFIFTPNLGYHVADVVVNGTTHLGSVTSYNPTITGDTSVDVTFAVNSFLVTVNVGSNGLSNLATQTVDSGTSLSFIFTPNLGYHVADVVVNGTTHLGSVTSYNPTITGDTSVDVTFAVNSFLVTVNVGSNGLSNLATQTVDSGTSLSFIFTPNLGYHVADVVVNGTTHLGSVTSYNPTITGDTSVDVTFAVNSFLVTVNVGSNGLSNLATQMVDSGTSLSFIFTPNLGYHVADVVVNGTTHLGSVTSYNPTITGDTSVDVTFAVNSFLVTVNVGSNGLSNLATQTVDSGTSLSFIFTPNLGYHVADVVVNGTTHLGSVTSYNPTITGDTSVDVTFAVNSFLVTVNVGSNGLSNLATQTVDSGTSLSFIFTPNLGYHVADVVVNGTTHLGSVTSYNPTITGDTSVDVTFAVNSFLVTVNVGSNGLSNLATQTVDSGTSLSFIFTPNLGYHVADVVVNGTTHLGSVTSYNPTITGDTSVDVTFAVNSFLVTVNVGSNGLSNLATQTVDSGTSLSFIFTPNLGYHVADVVVNGTTHLGSVTSYNPTITGDTSVDVTFAVNSFLVTVNVGSNGLSNLATQTVDSGTSLSFIFTPNLGYHVADVVVNGTTHLGSVTSYNPTITGDTSVDVTFAVNSFLVTVNVGSNGLSNLATQTVDSGTSLSFIFTPNLGYHVADVVVNGTTHLGSVTSYNPTITGDTSVDVTFAVNSFLVTVNVGSNGLSNLATQTVDSGTSLSFIFTPNLGYHVADVVVNGTTHLGSVTSYNPTITGDTSVDVTFAVNLYLVTVNVGSNGLSNLATQMVDSGTSLSFIFTPNLGYHVADVVVNGTTHLGSVTSYNPTITGDTSVDVTFAVNLFLVTVNVGSNGLSNLATQMVDSGTSLSFIFTPNLGYHVADVVVNGTTHLGSVTSYNPTITGDTSVDVTFAVNLYLVTVNVGSNGLSNLATQMVDSGTSLSFIFTPNLGYHVADVVVNGTTHLGSVTSYNPTITGDTSVDVTFAVNLYLVTVNVGSNGLSNLATQMVDSGASLSFIFTPNLGYHVADVVVNGTTHLGSVTSYNPTITGDTSVDVTFAVNLYLVTVNVGSNGLSNLATQMVDSGASLSFLFTPNLGYHVADVVVNGTTHLGSVTSYNPTITGDTSVDVTFAVNLYLVTVNVGSNGLSNLATQMVDSGASLSFLFTPNLGYHVADVVVNGTTHLGSVTSYNPTITGDTSVDVTFAVNLYLVTVNVGSNGLSNLATQMVDSGASLSFLFTPNLGYHVADVVVNGTTHLGSVTSYNPTITGDTSVDVTFAVNLYLVTVNVGSNGLSNLATQMVDSGASLSFLFTPNLGYHVADVVVNGTTHLGSVTSYNPTITGDTSVDVTFAVNLYLTWTQTTLTDFNSGNKNNVETTTIGQSDGDLILSKTSGVTTSTFNDNFNDGILESGWTVDKSSLSQWIKIDLGSIFSINTVKVYQSNFPNYFTQDYQIQISTDDVVYTTVGTNTLQASINNVGTNTFTATNARYVKIVILSHYLTGLSQGLNEIEVFQSGNPSTNIALNKAVTASSQWSSNYAPVRVVDGLKGTVTNASPYPWLCADNAAAYYSTISETGGVLSINAAENSFAHIERSLALSSNTINVTLAARIQVQANTGTSWCPKIALYWASGDWCGIGISNGNFITNVNVYSSQTEGFAAYSGAAPNVFLYVKIFVNSTTIQFSKSSDGLSWIVLRTASRPTSYNGSPSLLIVGKGYGNGGYTQGGYTYPNPDLDNNYPPTAGNFATSYIDDLTLTTYNSQSSEQYVSTGVFTSSVFDATSLVTWQSIYWASTLPQGTSIAIQTRSGNNLVPDSSWSNWSTIYSNSGDLILSPNNRYIQYRITFQTTNTEVTPILQSISIQYLSS